VISQIVLDEEARSVHVHDDAGLGLVVGNVASVLDELREIDLVKGKASDFRDELKYWSQRGSDEEVYYVIRCKKCSTK
jgi:hypothetical protein